MTKKLKIALLLGGTSSEREVSLDSGKQMDKHLDRKKYVVKKYDPKFDLNKLFNDCLSNKIDVVLNGLHGKTGEDGIIQGMLEMLKVPYTGSKVLASALAMNKIASKNLFIQNNIPTPPFYVLTKGEKHKASFPCVVKPADSGSSVGVSIVKNKSQLTTALKKAFKESDEVIIEKYIKGLELSIPILDKRPLPVIEIVPKKEFFDYQAKYTPNYCDEIVPARISSPLTKQAQKIAISAHQCLFCQSYSRVDIILDKNNKFWVLEVNTLPGMTINSLVPKSAKAAGIEFDQLLDEIIRLALKRGF